MLKQAELTGKGLTALSQVPYAVLVASDRTSGGINQIIKAEWPNHTMQHTYRYLQIWKGRCWIKHAENSRLWVLTNMGEILLERQINEVGWPQWLTKHGYNVEAFVLPNRSDTKMPS